MYFTRLIDKRVLPFGVSPVKIEKKAFINFQMQTHKHIFVIIM